MSKRIGPQACQEKGGSSWKFQPANQMWYGSLTHQISELFYFFTFCMFKIENNLKKKFVYYIKKIIYVKKIINKKFKKLKKKSGTSRGRTGCSVQPVF